MKKLFAGCAALLLMAGCSTPEKTESLTCHTSGENGNPSISATYRYSIGETPRLVSMESETTVVFDGNDFTKESQEELIKSYDEAYGDIEGFEHSYTVDDEKLVEKLAIDFDTISESALKNLDWPYEAGAAFDLETFKGNMTEIGWTCE